MHAISSFDPGRIYNTPSHQNTWQMSQHMLALACVTYFNCFVTTMRTQLCFPRTRHIHIYNNLSDLPVRKCIDDKSLKWMLQYLYKHFKIYRLFHKWIAVTSCVVRNDLNLLYCVIVLVTFGLHIVHSVATHSLCVHLQMLWFTKENIEKQ